MNFSTAIFLISDEARAVVVTYEAHEGAERTLYKTLDPDIAVDDFVVVPTDTRHKMTVCKVVEVDVDVDFDSAAEIKWILGRVDTADIDEIRRQEEDAITKIKSAEKRSKREELRKKLLDDVGEESLKALPIYTSGEAGE